jgi:hypothetical protein
MRKRVNGRMLDRFCDKCGRWCGRSNRARWWTKLTGGRLGNLKDTPVYCTWCLPPHAAAALEIRLAQVVENSAVERPTPPKKK